MLDLNSLQVKKAYYLNALSDLKDKDISEEVEIRLAPERARIEKEIREENEADIVKCENYIELLNTLIETEMESPDKEEEITEEPIEEETREVEEETEETIEEENNITEENVTPEINDPFQVRPEV